MSRIRSVNSKPEVIVRSLLHRLGFRFRKNVKTLPGKPDIVLKRHNTIIFIHGCFWHRHSGCKRANMPKSRQDYWEPKLEGNVQRDLTNIRELQSKDWKVSVIWECEIKDMCRLEESLVKLLDAGKLRSVAVQDKS